MARSAGGSGLVPRRNKMRKSSSSGTKAIRIKPSSTKSTTDFLARMGGEECPCLSVSAVFDEGREELRTSARKKHKTISLQGVGQSADKLWERVVVGIFAHRRSHYSPRRPPQMPPRPRRRRHTSVIFGSPRFASAFKMQTCSSKIKRCPRDPLTSILARALDRLYRHFPESCS